MSPRRSVASVLVAVLVAALTAVTSPPPAAEAAPAEEMLPPYFATAGTSGAYTISVNGVRLTSDATGFNHWGGEMPFYSARTGLLVEADRVTIRVERPVGQGAFSVGIQVFVCTGSGPDDTCDAVDVKADLESYDVDAQCDASSTAVVMPVLTSNATPEDPYEYLNFRRAFLVGVSSAEGSVHRFDCVLTMDPGAPLRSIASVLLEVGQTSAFRAEAAQFITDRVFELEISTEPTEVGDTAYDGVLTAASCSYLTGKGAADLATEIGNGGTATELERALSCPDGRVDLSNPLNEAHVLPVFANPRSFASNLTAWGP